MPGGSFVVERPSGHSTGAVALGPPVATASPASPNRLTLRRATVTT